MPRLQVVAPLVGTTSLSTLAVRAVELPGLLTVVLRALRAVGTMAHQIAVVGESALTHTDILDYLI